MDTAAQRAQVTQITKYNTAANTFRLKYGYLPGDIPDPTASQFGFIARGGSSRGEGDGNGVLEGGEGQLDFYGGSECNGETIVFWRDLNQANLIEGGFNSASSTPCPGTITGTTSLSQYFPNAKIGNSNYVYIWSGGLGSNTETGNGQNYFAISGITDVGNPDWRAINTTTAITVLQAYNMDKKIDDGLPQSGNVTALYDNWNVPYTGQIGWAAGGGNFGANAGAPNYGATTAAAPYLSTNCYDNNGVAGTQKYSVTQNANLPNCALSFKFQ